MVHHAKTALLSIGIIFYICYIKETFLLIFHKHVLLTPAFPHKNA